MVFVSPKPLPKRMFRLFSYTFKLHLINKCDKIAFFKLRSRLFSTHKLTIQSEFQLNFMKSKFHLAHEITYITFNTF